MYQTQTNTHMLHTQKQCSTTRRITNAQHPLVCFATSRNQQRKAHIHTRTHDTLNTYNTHNYKSKDTSSNIRSPNSMSCAHSIGLSGEPSNTSKHRRMSVSNCSCSSNGSADTSKCSASRRVFGKQRCKHRPSASVIMCVAPSRFSRR